jgi:hypothetical protein
MEGSPTMFRLHGISLGGKLSLTYLAVASVLLLLGGRSSEWFLTVVGFPLLFAPWAVGKVFGEFRPSPPVGITVFVLLWVGNAYLWGHTIAAVVQWLGRRGQGKGPADQPPHDPSVE